MKSLTCEMCGSTDMLKDDGVFVCQSCGMKYSVEEAKKMMIEGTVEVQGTVKVDKTGETESLLKRAFMLLEDGDFGSAHKYCDKVLDIDPENAHAYLGKLMAEFKISKQEKLKDCVKPFDNNSNYQKAMRFGDEDLKQTLDHLLEQQVQNQINLNVLQEKAAWASELLKFMVDYQKIKHFVGGSADEPERRFFLGSSGCVEIQNDGQIKTYGTHVLNGWSDIGCSSKNEDLEKWSNVKRFSTTYFHAIALKNDGKSVAYGWSTNACRVGQWGNLIAVAAGDWHTVGLKKDGTVVATGERGLKGPDDEKINFSGDFCKVESWNEIISINAGMAYSIGVKKDGHVVCAYGCNGVELGDMQLSLNTIEEWENILAVVEDMEVFVGVRKDGTIISTASSSLEGKTLFSSLDEIDEKWFVEAKRKFIEELSCEAEKEEAFINSSGSNGSVSNSASYQDAPDYDNDPQIRAIRRNMKKCQYCGGKFGLFKKCQRCGKKKDY